MSLSRAQKIVTAAYRDALSSSSGRIMMDDWLMWLMQNPTASASQLHQYTLSRLSLPRRDSLLTGDIKMTKKPLIENLEGV
jgi:hypothetical protein